MHMSDALVSAPVFAATAAASAVLLGVAVRKVGRSGNSAGRERILPLMGVMGAFVFAAQMINFAIPGTGSSGHIVGGILLSAILGPWAAFLTLASVLVVQCMVFADGGLLALGCNILNMAALSCLVAYPLVFRPLVRKRMTGGRIAVASLLSSVLALLLGAFAVTAETEASGITALPFSRFLMFMLPIHLVIGIGEGLATCAVLCVVRRGKPELLAPAGERSGPVRRIGITLAAFAVAAILLGGVFSRVASSLPDGLEWSIERAAEKTGAEPADRIHKAAENVQNRTALMPDYDTSAAGVIGSGSIILLVLGLSCVLRGRQKSS